MTFEIFKRASRDATNGSFGKVDLDVVASSKVGKGLGMCASIYPFDSLVLI